ncbi:MAG: kelch repeat-containing protein, partial [archaeon]|nr:kelch repeat-containing protein [archaeon]
MVIWAGADGEGLFSSTLFVFSFSTRDWSALAFSASSVSPCPRHFHSYVLYGERLYIFGGKSNGYLSDLWVFDFCSRAWQELDGHHSKSPNKPIARFGHSAVCYGEQMIVFGGYDQHGFCCEDITTWNFSAAPGETSWGRIKTEHPGAIPGGLERYHHSAVVSDHSMYIFGGRNSVQTCEPDLVEFHIPTRQVNIVKTVGTAPGPRWGHSAAVSGGKMYVFGGCDGAVAFSDLYSYSFVARTWELIKVSTCPSLRYFSTLCALGDELGSLCVMGGKDSSNHCMSDIHIFRPVTAGGSLEAGKIVVSIPSYELSSSVPSSPSSPPPNPAVSPPFGPPFSSSSSS